MTWLIITLLRAENKSRCRRCNVSLTKFARKPKRIAEEEEEAIEHQVYLNGVIVGAILCSKCRLIVYRNKTLSRSENQYDNNDSVLDSDSQLKDKRTLNES